MFIGLIRHNICPAFGGGGGCIEITATTGVENITVGEYESFTLDADVLTGSTPITYQWQVKDPEGGSWQDISGANSSSYTESAGLGLEQSYTEYRCNMSNDCSSVTSRLIIVEVTGFLP